ncbi:cell cycle control protein 50A-like [Schistocerca serialis cubense]|uniref:cell cycle control protein 50A-like n=1 Tax=Schistocerca serialis cubense TaxID=2023355 RepID=UPI00214E1B84|nr:cell cycle control protein 50A-like [Schistocerca serialis cubense]
MASEDSEPQRVLSGESVESWDMKRHASSAFKQQRLPAWSPVLSPATVLPVFLVTGAILIPAGVALLFLSETVGEHRIAYTYCPQYFQENRTFGERNCAVVIAETNETCHCAYNFSLKRSYRAPVFIYYQLSNYYQNHRRYVNSRDDYQLRGKLYDRVSSYCAPYDYDDEGRPIAPCGAIADSLFNDSLRLELRWLGHPDNETEEDAEEQEEQVAGRAAPPLDVPLPMDVPVLRTGIAWPSDKQRRYANPPGNLTAALAGFAKPRSWRRHVYELDPDNEDNNGFVNEDLIVWMRTSALPKFRKLYRRVDHSREPFADGLPAGNYTLHVEYNYPVASFSGSKVFIVTSTTAVGAGNQFLGAAYVTCGCVCMLLGAMFVALHLRYRQAAAFMVTVERETPYL